MSEKEILSKKFIMVGMDDADITTADKYIIGTQALATCVGVLLYSENSKRAIVAHVSSDVMKALDKIFKLIVDNKLYREQLKYKIICGTYTDAHDYYDVIDILKKHFKDYVPFNDNELTASGVKLDENTFSHEFAFDALTGKFVTDKVLFGTDYYVVNGNSFTQDVNANKHR